jgi:hypothetical protein
LSEEEDEETLSTEEDQTMLLQKRRALEIESTHYCPLCNINSNTTIINKMRAKNYTYLHKIMSCVEFNATAGLNESQEKLRVRLAQSRAFKCTCTYFRPNDNCNSAPMIGQYDAATYVPPTPPPPPSQDEDAGSNNAAYDADDETYLNYLDEEEVLSANNKNPNSKKECLVAYMGMAVKGYNLAYKQWVSEEHCFNLCLSTTKRNGYSFDCKSFEHWQTDCTGQPRVYHPNETFVPRICSQSGHGNNEENNVSTLSAARSSTLSRGLRAINKIEYCVLSNQSRSTAGDDFTENSAVTYYEILCKSKPNCGLDYLRI